MDNKLQSNFGAWTELRLIFGITWIVPVPATAEKDPSAILFYTFSRLGEYEENKLSCLFMWSVAPELIIQGLRISVCSFPMDRNVPRCARRELVGQDGDNFVILFQWFFGQGNLVCLTSVFLFWGCCFGCVSLGTLTIKLVPLVLCVSRSTHGVSNRFHMCAVVCCNDHTTTALSSFPFEVYWSCLDYEQP